MERSGFSPTPSRSSPGDTQHDADAMEEIANTSNKESPASDLQEDPPSIPNSVENLPAGIKRWPADKADCSTAYAVKADENFHNINPENCVGEARAKVRFAGQFILFPSCFSETIVLHVYICRFLSYYIRTLPMIQDKRYLSISWKIIYV